MKKIISVLLCMVFCLSFSACSPEEPYREKTFFVMDAALTVRLWGCDEQADALFANALSLVREIERDLSRTDPESDVSRINREGSAGDLSAHTLAVLSLALEVSTKTQGAYLPTMGVVADLWQQAGESDKLPDEALLQEALAAARQGFHLENGVCTILGQGATLDLGGIGKGYAVDCLLDYFHEASVPGALISFGSSVATLGEKGDGSDFRISLRDPKDANATKATLNAPRGSLSVSGDYERFVTVGGERYHHILDPDTAYPCENGLSSVSVLCESGALADALSTALFVIGEQSARELLDSGAFEAEAVFITASGKLTHTSGLSDILEAN